MGKAKKLAAAGLALLALAAVPATSGNGESVHLACQGGSGSAGCYG